MSNVSYMEMLLDDVDVQWLPLGDIATIYGGLTGKSKSDFENGSAKYISYKNIFNNIEVDLNQLELVRIESHERQHLVEYGDVLFTGSSEIASEAGMSCAVTTKFDFPVYLNSFSFGVRFHQGINITPEFSKYLFRSRFMRTEIAKSASGVTRFNVSKARFKKILVPIPCPETPEKSLQIQAEIVRILDAFTSLTAELTAELSARKKQYNYYRDKLLSFEDGAVEWKPLGSLATITIGEFVHKDKQDDSAQYPVYNGGRTATGYYENYNNTGNKIIVSARGANAGFVNRVSTPYWAGNSCYSIGIKDSSVLNWDFVYYFLKLSESKLIGSQQKGGIPAVSKKQMESFLVPVPELAHQERIVAVLDKFDALTNSITEGLPREIELRQKQYEYYRDLLLSFPKPDEQVA